MREQGESASKDNFLGEVDLKDAKRQLDWIVQSVRFLDRRIDDNEMVGSQIIAELAELFPPAVLFSNEINTIQIAYKA